MKKFLIALCAALALSVLLASCDTNKNDQQDTDTLTDASTTVADESDNKDDSTESDEEDDDDGESSVTGIEGFESDLAGKTFVYDSINAEWNENITEEQKQEYFENAKTSGYEIETADDILKLLLEQLGSYMPSAVYTFNTDGTGKYVITAYGSEFTTEFNYVQDGDNITVTIYNDDDTSYDEVGTIVDENTITLSESIDYCSVILTLKAQ